MGAVEGNERNIEDNLARMANNFGGLTIETSVGFPRGNRDGVLNLRAIRDGIRWASGNRDHVEKYAVKINEEPEPIDIFSEQMKITRDMNLDNLDVDANYEARRRFFRRSFDDYLPVIERLFTKALILAVFGSVFAWFAAGQDSYQPASIYSGIFDILSIFTGFLATFYVFVITKGNEFLERIRGTATYSMVLKLLKFTILWSTGMIAASYVLMIVNPTGYDLFSFSHLVVFAWIANVALIAVNFARCVVQFSTIISAERV